MLRSAGKDPIDPYRDSAAVNRPLRAAIGRGDALENRYKPVLGIGLRHFLKRPKPQQPPRGVEGRAAALDLFFQLFLGEVLQIDLALAELWAGSRLRPADRVQLFG